MKEHTKQILTVVAPMAIAVVVIIGAMVYSYSSVPSFERPMASSTDSVAKQVATTIVYGKQEEAVALSDIFQQERDSISISAISARADVSARHSSRYDKSILAHVKGTEDKEIDEAVSSPQEVLSHDGAESDMPSRSISIKGDVVPYVDSFESASAPVHGAGLWMGTDNVDDGTWGYFIGHNPGDFTAVMSLVEGDEITVKDSNGNSRTYHVIDAFTVPDTTYWEDIQGHVNGYGESVIVQTCCGDNENYRIVVAD